MDVNGIGGGGAVASENSTKNVSSPSLFLSKTYAMVDDPLTDSIVSWGPWNNTFVVWEPLVFTHDLLPKYVMHNNFASFVQQLNTYLMCLVNKHNWKPCMLRGKRDGGGKLIGFCLSYHIVELVPSQNVESDGAKMEVLMEMDFPKSYMVSIPKGLAGLLNPRDFKDKFCINSSNFPRLQQI